MENEFNLFRASSAGLRNAGEIEAFREQFGRSMLRLEMTPLNGMPLEWDVTIRSLSEVALATGSLSPMSNHHPEALGDDSLMLAVLHVGHAELQQLGRSAVLDVGQAMLLTNAEASTFVGHTATRQTNIRLRRDLLAMHLPDPHAAMGRPIAANHYALRLLLGYADLLGDRDVALDADACRIVSANIYDLAALAIGGARDARVHGRGVRAARLHAIKVDVRRSLGQHDLSIGTVARRHGISGSYARRLFAEAGTSFADFVLEQRLALAHRLLTDPRRLHRTISTIAYEVGFGDLSYFNRTFRRRYGMTPSDVRAGAGE